MLYNHIQVWCRLMKLYSIFLPPNLVLMFTLGMACLCLVLLFFLQKREKEGGGWVRGTGGLEAQVLRMECETRLVRSSDSFMRSQWWNQGLHLDQMNDGAQGLMSEKGRKTKRNSKFCCRIWDVTLNNQPSRDSPYKDRHALIKFMLMSCLLPKVKTCWKS